MGGDVREVVSTATGNAETEGERRRVVEMSRTKTTTGYYIEFLMRDDDEWQPLQLTCHKTVQDAREAMMRETNNFPSIVPQIAVEIFKAIQEAENAG